MAITTETNRTAELVTDGIETEFDFSMLIHADIEIQVWYQATGGDYAELILDTDYTVVFTENGGTITTIGGSSPYAAGKILIIRHLPITQLTNWLYNDNHTEQTHQDDFDRSVMRDLQIQEQLDRCVGFAIHSGTKDVEFPEPEANEIIGWNAAGDALENKTPTSLIASMALDDLDDVDATANDGSIIVGNGAIWVEESGATARASLGLTIGSDVQAWDAQLDDIATLAVTNGNFIVGDGSNWIIESGDTARTSLGLGTGDSPTHAGLTITGNSVFGLNSSVFQPTTDSTTFFQVLDADGGTPILNVDSTNERVGIGTATPSSTFDVVGTLDFSDVTGDVSFFDNELIADVAHGNAIRIHRHANEADDETLFYIGHDRALRIASSYMIYWEAQNNITFFSGKHISMQLGDNAGNRIFQVLDSDSVAVSKIDSNGNAWFGGNIGIYETAPETLLEMSHAQPTITGHCITHSDLLDARAVIYQAFGEQSGGEETTLGKFMFAHDSALDDEKAYWKLFINTGADGDNPTQALEIGSDLLATFAGSITSAGLTTIGTVDASGGEILVEDNDTSEPAGKNDGYVGVAQVGGQARLYFFVDDTRYYCDAEAAAADPETGNPLFPMGGLLWTYKV